MLCSGHSVPRAFAIRRFRCCWMSLDKRLQRKVFGTVQLCYGMRQNSLYHDWGIGFAVFRSTHIIATMNHEEFLVELKKMVAHSDWHRRYYTKRARKYKRIDYWRVFGAMLAAGSAFLLASILPNFRWDAIVSGLKDEQEEWMRIYQGYEGLLNMSKVLNRDEMLLQEYQRVEETRKALALNDRNLPEDQTLLDETEDIVRDYWGLIPRIKKP